jgi:hypothetical protein
LLKQAMIIRKKNSTSRKHTHRVHARLLLSL